MIDTVSALQNAKKRFFKAYLGVYECMDPETARHLLNAQKEVLLAGREFFAGEAEHARKAADRMGKRAKE